MRASSLAAREEGLRVLTETLDSVPATSSSELAEQFFVAADTFAHSAKLSAALTDIARSGEDRGALVCRIFSQFDEAVLTVLQTLVAQRWTAPADLAEVTDYLGAQTLIWAAQQSGEAGYLQEQLFEVSEAIKEHVELRRVLADRSQSTPAQRAQLIERVFSGSVRPDTLALAKRAAMRTSLQPVLFSLRGYRQQIAAVLDVEVATVRTATPLSPAQHNRLSAALERIYGRKILINIAEDPRLVGGMRVSVGSDVYDGTLRTALASAQRSVAG